MTDIPRYFNIWRDIESRATFDASCGITPEEPCQLLGEYHIAEDEERPCQVERNGKRCGEDHKNGWLGRKENGQEGLIGYDCGTKYFRANESFVLERRRLSRELNITTNLERLKSTFGNPDYLSALELSRGRVRSIRASVKELQEKLPLSINRRLESMVKSRSGALEVQFRYDDDEDEEGNPKINWVTQQVANVSGFEIWDELEFRALFGILHEIRDTTQVVRLDRDAGEIKLRRWADIFAQLPGCMERIARLQNALEQFTEAGNLRMLCIAVPNQGDGQIAASLAMEYAGLKAGPDGGSRKYMNDVYAEVRALADGRSFRISF